MTQFHVCAFASKFTGKERDAESGLDYFGARYYNSAMGRFSSPDPSGLVFADPTNPQSFNLYNYVLNNPLVNVDPNGLDCVYIDNDTGTYKGFTSGDCDNSTADRANSGYYIDGTVNEISFNNQNQVLAYSASNSDGFFGTPGSNSNGGPASSSINPYANPFSVKVITNLPDQNLQTLPGWYGPHIPTYWEKDGELDRKLGKWIDSVQWVGCIVAPQTVMDTRDAMNTVQGKGRSKPSDNSDTGSPAVPFMPNNNRGSKNGYGPAATNGGDAAMNAAAAAAQYIPAAIQCGQGGS